MKNMIKILMLVAALAVVVLAQEPVTEAPVAPVAPVAEAPIEEAPVSSPVAEPQTDAPVAEPESSGQEPLQYTTGGVIVFSVYTGTSCTGTPYVGPSDLNNDFSQCQFINAQAPVGNIYFRIACLANDTVVGTTYGTTPGCSSDANPLPSAASGSCYPIPASATGGIPMVFKGICPSAPSTPTPVATPSEASSVLLSSFLIVTLSAVLLSFL